MFIVLIQDLIMTYVFP